VFVKKRSNLYAQWICRHLRDIASSSSVSNDPGEGSIISYYFSRGYTYEVINEFLVKFHGITMCVRTLKNKLRQLKLRRRMPSFDMDVVREQIMNELSGPGCQGGCRSMWHTLRLKNIQVPRRVEAELMREMDLEGCEQRKSKSLKRRSYFSSGPNCTWHVDGYDKLRPYGWLKVTKSNNQPDIIANFYLNCVAELRGCPVKLRTDCGTENGVMAAMQSTFQEDADVIHTLTVNLDIVPLCPLIMSVTDYCFALSFSLLYN